MRALKALAVAATALASAALNLVPAAQASTPTGGPINTVTVDGVATTGTPAISGTYKGGTYSFGGGTYGCSGGSLGGTIQRGATGATAGNIAFASYTYICAQPIGGNSVVSLHTPGCMTADFSDSNVHNGLVDTGTGTKFSRVDGRLTMPANCVRYSALGGICTAWIVGTTDVFLDETQKAPNNAQDLILNGSGLSFTGQSGCLGLITGPITLNNFTFNVTTPSPISGVGGIDFRETHPSPPTGGAIAAVEVNGSTAPGTIPVHGSLEGGTYSHGGGTFRCTQGSAAGAINRGPRPLPIAAHDLSISSLTLVCATVVGGNATLQVADPACLTADFHDTNVHDGTVDAGDDQLADLNNVAGVLTMPADCVRLRALGDTCTAWIVGAVPAFFDEANMPGNAQKLIIDGSGLNLTGQSGCLGLLAGPTSFNDITFSIEVTGGTTTGVDFRQSPN